MVKKMKKNYFFRLQSCSMDKFLNFKNEYFCPKFIKINSFGLRIFKIYFFLVSEFQKIGV